MSKRITISSGHWNTLNSGASGILNEVTEARKVTNEVVKILKASGIDVVKVEDNQSKNQQDNLNYLIGQQKKSNSDIDISIHFNSSTGTHTRAIGTEVLYYASNMKDKATALSKAISNVGGFINRGAKYRDNLGFLLNLKNSLLIEVCFVNSVEDARLYRKNFDTICHAIADALANMIGESLKLELEATLHRVQSGSFTSKADAELAKSKVAANHIAKLEYINIYETTNKRFYFVTGTYGNGNLANEALEKMKKIGIVQVGNVIKA